MLQSQSDAKESPPTAREKGLEPNAVSSHKYAKFSHSMQTRHSKDLARIHVFGAAGSGVTTLSKTLAEALCLPYRDTDEYLWMPEPPYQTKRPLEARIDMLRRDAQAPAWILGGSLDQWGADAIVSRLTLAIFLTLDQEERLARLKIRERLRFGDRIASGGECIGSTSNLWNGQQPMNPVV